METARQIIRLSVTHSQRDTAGNTHTAGQNCGIRPQVDIQPDEQTIPHISQTHIVQYKVSDTERVMTLVCLIGRTPV